MPETTLTCYRHPGREAPLLCTRCERPICLDDAVDAPVGYLCPDDARQAARVRRVAAGGRATVTKALVGLLVAVAVAQQLLGPSFTAAALTYGPDVAAGQWWRLVTGAFVHGGLLHLAFNGYLLWQLGLLLEPVLGRVRFLALYAAGLAGGSAGVVLLSWDAPTVGASGAVFGLMGAALVLYRRAGVNPWQTSIGTLVVLNLVFTFLVPQISVGGHVGGLLGGVLATRVMVAGRDRALGSVGSVVAAWGVAAALLALAVTAGVAGPLVG